MHRSICENVKTDISAFESAPSICNTTIDATKHYLFASDFDQTLSFNDSGVVLSEMLGLTGFHEKVAGACPPSTSSNRARS